MELLHDSSPAAGMVLAAIDKGGSYSDDCLPFKNVVCEVRIHNFADARLDPTALLRAFLLELKKDPKFLVGIKESADPALCVRIDAAKAKARLARRLDGQLFNPDEIESVLAGLDELFGSDPAVFTTTKDGEPDPPGRSPRVVESASGFDLFRTQIHVDQATYFFVAADRIALIAVLTAD